MSPWGFESHILCMIRYTVRETIGYILRPVNVLATFISQYPDLAYRGVHCGPVTIEENVRRISWHTFFPQSCRNDHVGYVLADTD